MIASYSFQGWQGRFPPFPPSERETEKNLQGETSEGGGNTEIRKKYIYH